MSRNPPDMGALRLDDSDDDSLFDSPDQPKDKSKTESKNNGSVPEPTPSRSQPSKYSSAEAREALLRKELESIRGINKVVEDVIASLEKARGNMDVGGDIISCTHTLTCRDCAPHRAVGIYTSWHLDSHLVADGTQSETTAKSQLERRISGPRGHGKRDSYEAASSREESRRGGNQARSCCKAGR